jgi:hypothetical protein
MPKSRSLVSLCAACCSLTVVALVPARAQAKAGDAPVAYSSVNELNSIVTPLQDTAKSIDGNLSRLRIDKWKMDSAAKRDLQGNVESIRRNLQSALPEILGQVNNAPEDLAASFKLYRNLDALYDVFGPVVESAGAFGSKDEYQSLSNDMSALQNARRALGERMQNLAAAKENDLARLRVQLKAAQAAAAPATPPTKKIVDDTEPTKKPTPKKKTAKPAATTTTPPSATPK